LTNDNDVELKNLTDYVRQELGGANGSHALVPLLFKMGEFDRAEQMTYTLHQSISEENLRKVMCFNRNLGLIRYGNSDL